MTNPTTTIIDIDRQGISFCLPTLAQPLRFDFTPEMIADLEVVDSLTLVASLKKFVSQTKVPPSSVVFLVSESICFEKDFPGQVLPSPASVQSFVDTVPFSNSSFKLFNTSGGYKLVVINRHIHDTISQAFEGLGFTVAAVVPGFVLGEVGIPTVLTAESCHLAFRKIDYLTARSFIKDVQTPIAGNQTSQAFFAQHKQMLIVIGIMVIVFSVAMIAIFILRR